MNTYGETVVDVDAMHTAAVHAGELRPAVQGAVSMPIFQSSTYVMQGVCAFDDIRYVRLNNTPNHQAVAAKLAALAQAEAALVTPSGTAAIFAVLFSRLQRGDQVLYQRGIYRGSYKLLARFRDEYGIELCEVDGQAPEQWHAALSPRSKLFYFESLTNPGLQIPDLAAGAAFCREHQLLSVIDNTLLTPLNFRPLSLGFDLVVHSASKYLNGHADVVAGVVAGRHAVVESVRRAMNLAGLCLDPLACFLLQRGLKTLTVRVPRQCATARMLAQCLREHPAVRQMRYPGLATDPAFAAAQRWFQDAGAVLTLQLHAGVAPKVLSRLRLIQVAPSLGGVESLICQPSATSHAGLDMQAQQAQSVNPDLLRLSVGLESVAALSADLLQALS